MPITDVNVNLNGSILTATVNYCNETTDNHIQYYFYLLKDGTVIDKKGWFPSSSYDWFLAESGVYRVQGYARVGDLRELQLSNEVIYIKSQGCHPPEKHSSELSLPAKVSIFGSCTSRDLFRLFPSALLELKTYIARQSVISAVSAPVPLEMEQIHLTSNFQRQMVWQDFNKQTFDLFRNDESDWLIIDFIDERFAPVRIGDSYVTKSASAVEAGVISSSTKGSGRVWNGKDFIIDNICLRNYVIQFATKLLEIYKPDHIIIHRAMNVDQYRDADGKLCEFSDHEKEIAKTINDILKYMYDYLKKCIPEAKEINIISSYYGSEQHLWGKATVHYEEEYYGEVMEQIKEYIKKTVSEFETP